MAFRAQCCFRRAVTGKDSWKQRIEAVEVLLRREETPCTAELVVRRPYSLDRSPPCQQARDAVDQYGLGPKMHVIGHRLENHCLCPFRGLLPPAKLPLCQVSLSEVQPHYDQVTAQVPCRPAA